jgi:hypothetical protein
LILLQLDDAHALALMRHEFEHACQYDESAGIYELI